MDAYGFALLARSSGTSNASTSFEVALLSVQLLVSMLNGLGVGYQLEPGSLPALSQVASILAVQLTFSLWVFCVSASSDRLTTLSTGIQFGLEAGQTTLLLMYTLFLHSSLEMASFIFAVASLCTPIIQLAYDSITQLIWAFRDGFSLRAACHNFVSLLFYLPRMVLFSLGMQVQSGADAFAEHAGDDFNRAKERSYDDFANQTEQVSGSSAAVERSYDDFADEHASGSFAAVERAYDDFADEQAPAFAVTLEEDDFTLSSDSSQDDRQDDGSQENERLSTPDVYESSTRVVVDVPYLRNQP